MRHSTIPALVMWAALLTGIVAAFLARGELPEKVATHYDLAGNPDGWMNNETGLTSGWRKNKRDNNGSGQFETNVDGVDLNRNFDWGWSLNGSGNPSSSIYRGPSAGSEPEVQVCQDLLTANPPILAVSDSLIIAPKTDGVILVADAHQSSKGAVEHTRERAKR